MTTQESISVTVDTSGELGQMVGRKQCRCIVCGKLGLWERYVVAKWPDSNVAIQANWWSMMLCDSDTCLPNLADYIPQPLTIVVTEVRRISSDASADT